MKTITESLLIEKEGYLPHSISLNSTGNKVTPFSTHIKIYKDNKHFFESGDYHYSLIGATKSFEERCKENDTEEKTSMFLDVNTPTKLTN